MEGLETIEMVIEDEESNGVSALSLVGNPATQDETVLLSKQDKSINLSDVLHDNKVLELAEVDEEKQLILGLVLEPDTPIYRRDGDKEYNITFKAHTVGKAAHMYMANLNNNNVTLEHQDSVEGVSLVESWIVLDSQKDKSAVYGKEYKAGSWAVVMKIHDKAQWEQYKKDGTTNISLEGIFKPKQTKLSAAEKLVGLKKVLSK